MTHTNPPIRYGLLSAALALFAAVFVAAAQPYSMNLSENESESRWRVVLDGVMGGLSSGELMQTDDGILFRGELSLENNGGFSQIRTPVEQGSFAGADGIEITVRGDGRTYIFDTRAANMRVMAGSYQLTFGTTDHEWTTIRLPFSEFRFHYFGRQVPGVGAIDAELVNSVGMTLAGKVPGDFELEVGAIRGYVQMDPERQARLDGLSRILGLNDDGQPDEAVRDDDRAQRLEGLNRELARRERAREANKVQQQRMVQRATGSFASQVNSVCALAIERGAPLFNDGQPGACASVYEVALASILELGRDRLSGETRDMIASALRDGHRLHDAGERAWHYRRAIDALMH